MGYLNNSSITVDAILTKKGRELLARGKDEFKITQFALSDDEIDYDLWNPAHPLGTNYYGVVIENMPLVEATPNESNIMRYKLVTLPKKTARIPVINVQPGTSITLTSPGQTQVLTPTTINFAAGNSTLGYTAILSDSDVATLQVGTPVLNGVSPTVPRFIGDAEAAQSISATGFTFNIIAKQQLISDARATITIIGNETGGRATIQLTVKKTLLATAAFTPLGNASTL
jgi:hypothetical protein